MSERYAFVVDKHANRLQLTLFEFNFDVSLPILPFRLSPTVFYRPPSTAIFVAIPDPPALR